MCRPTQQLRSGSMGSPRSRGRACRPHHATALACGDLGGGDDMIVKWLCTTGTEAKPETPQSEQQGSSRDYNRTRACAVGTAHLKGVAPA